ncbi:hypothetical protein SLS60_005877 [Paraconiothyrium brasiliense]|uniref:Uncharacterized protein n=1 Tax=Paraconiothyrium brasiliense TaxID=300254 RepID=A0ABR3RDH3_9PLEO
MSTPNMSHQSQVPGVGASIELAPTEMGGQIVTLHFPQEGGTMYLPNGQAITFAPHGSQVVPPNQQVALVDEDVTRASGVHESDHSTASESFDSVMTDVEGNVPAAGGDPSEAGSDASESEDDRSAIATVKDPGSPSLTEQEAIFGEAFMSDDEWEEYYMSKAYRHDNADGPEGNDRNPTSDDEAIITQDKNPVIDLTQYPSSEDSEMEGADDASDSSEDPVVVPGRKRATQHNTPTSVVEVHHPTSVQSVSSNEASESEDFSNADEDSDDDRSKYTPDEGPDGDGDTHAPKRRARVVNYAEDSPDDGEMEGVEDDSEDDNTSVSSDSSEQTVVPDKHAPKRRARVVNYAEDSSDDEEMEDVDDDSEDDSTSVSSESSEQTVVPNKHAQGGAASDYDTDEDPVVPHGRSIRTQINTSKPVPDVDIASGSGSDGSAVVPDADALTGSDSNAVILAPADGVTTAESSFITLNMDTDMEDDFDRHVEESYFDQLAGKSPRSPSEWTSIQWTSQTAINGRFAGADQGPGSPFANFDPSIPRGPTHVLESPSADLNSGERNKVQEIAGEVGFKRHWGHRMPNLPARDRLPILTDEPATFGITKGELKKQALRRMDRYDPQTMEQFREIQHVVEAKECSAKSNMGHDGSNETSVEGWYEHEDPALESNRGSELQGADGLDRPEDGEEHRSAGVDEYL